MGEEPQPPRPDARDTVPENPDGATSADHARTTTSQRRRRSAGRPASARPGAKGGSPSSRTTVVVYIVAALAVVAVVLVVVRSGGGSPGGTATPNGSTQTTVAGSPPTTSPPTTLADSEFTSYVDDDAGFSIRYPKSWKQFHAADPNVHLVVAQPPPKDGPADVGLTIRVTRTEVPTTSENLDNVQAVTDGIVTSNPTVQILRRQKINGEIDGMPGYYYLYTFTDEATGRVGAHGHYFLFRGTKMNQLVLQAVPTEEYGRLGAMFDQVIESFKSAPDAGPAPTTPTTAAGG